MALYRVEECSCITCDSWSFLDEARLTTTHSQLQDLLSVIGLREVKFVVPVIERVEVPLGLTNLAEL